MQIKTWSNWISKKCCSRNSKTKITINAICPGYLDTDMTKKSISNISKITGLSDK